MSNVIRFPESMGTRQLSAAEYAASVAALDVDNLHKQALLIHDQSALSDLLGGRSNVFFGVFAAEEEDEEQPQVLAA
ncbi:hypothetical protein [Cognatiluteimonas profundi]|uniref:hypothetical protein n=1 Tax=Cognatiluteimonas profundi TaxID=2594501 RepID=UPI00131C2766|nr:hypothetical protein [Lysobacter profundi]